MAERKRFSGDRSAAFDYLGIGRLLLANLKQMMQKGGLQQLVRTAQLPNGVTITVSSIYGQDNVAIDAPPALQEEVNAQVEEAQRKEYLLPPNTPDAPDVPLSGISVRDSHRVRETITLDITSQVIAIGGADTGGNPVYWNSATGFRSLSKSRFGGGVRDAAVQALSSDGSTPMGWIECYDATVNPATINPFNGGGGKPFGYIMRACLWRDISNGPNVVNITSGDSASIALAMSGSTVLINGGTNNAFTGDATVTVGTAKKPALSMTWNGNNGTIMLPSTNAPPGNPPLKSADGTVEVSGNKYRFNGGEWVQWGASNCYGLCVTRGGGTTTSLVFSP